MAQELFGLKDQLGDKPFGLLELGSNSLKFYLVDSLSGPSPSIKTKKFPWRIAHEFFSRGALGDEAIEELTTSIKGVESYSKGIPLDSMLAVATGVFREIPNATEIAKHVKAATGIRIRVISGSDEAKLMARDFHLQETATGPTLLSDLGGATMEWAFVDNRSYRDWGSLPLGAIRNQYKFQSLRSDPAEYVQRSSKYCDEALRQLPIQDTVQVVATGGTAKAMAKCLGNNVVPLHEVRRLMEQVLREGAPNLLKPIRRLVFLPGIVILWRVLVRCKAQSFTYGKTSVRDGMAGRLTRLLGTYQRDKLHATLLLHSSQIYRKE